MRCSWHGDAQQGLHDRARGYGAAHRHRQVSGKFGAWLWTAECPLRACMLSLLDAAVTGIKIIHWHAEQSTHFNVDVASRIKTTLLHMLHDTITRPIY